MYSTSQTSSNLRHPGVTWADYPTETNFSTNNEYASTDYNNSTGTINPSEFEDDSISSSTHYDDSDLSAVFPPSLDLCKRICIFQGDICTLDCQAIALDVAYVFPTHDQYLDSPEKAQDCTHSGLNSGQELPCSLLRIAGEKNLIREYHNSLALHTGSQLFSPVHDELPSAAMDAYQDAVANNYGLSHMNNETTGTIVEGGYYQCLNFQNTNLNPAPDLTYRDVGMSLVVSSNNSNGTNACDMLNMMDPSCFNLIHPSKLMRGGEVFTVKGNLGDLKSQHLLFFSGPKFTRKYIKASRHTLHVTVREILKTCAEEKIKSVAIPIFYCINILLFTLLFK